jgi:hypothetical protein
MPAALQSWQIRVASWPDVIEWTQIELGLNDLQTADEIQAKRKETETELEDLLNRHDVATAKTVRLRTLLRETDQAMAAALEPFIKKEGKRTPSSSKKRPASELNWGFVRWIGDPSVCIVNWVEGAAMSITVRDRESDRATVANSKGAPAKGSVHFEREKLGGKHHWHLNPNDPLAPNRRFVVECGYFDLELPMLSGFREVDKWLKSHVDLDGLAAIQPSKP